MLDERIYVILGWVRALVCGRGLLLLTEFVFKWLNGIFNAFLYRDVQLIIKSSISSLMTQSSNPMHLRHYRDTDES